MSNDLIENSISITTPNLSFNKEEFRKDDFNVDQFVVSCRRHTSLEVLHNDLTLYMKTLQSAMIELINKDYADFVNLSSNLVGFDKAINNLTTPLGQLREEVLSVRTTIDDTITAVENKISHQKSIQQEKKNLETLIHIHKSVDKIEKLLGIHSTNSEVHNSDLNGPLLERVASEFYQLQFYVNNSTTALNAIKPRIAYITSTLQHSLEGSLLEGLQSGDEVILQRCLRTYVIIDKIKDAENLFRMQIVKPYMEPIITEDNLQQYPDGLGKMYKQILDFIPEHCNKIHAVLSGSATSKEDGIQGYDLLVNAVWPEIVANIEARVPSIFAPGNPNLFHEKYRTSMDFLDKFERQCASHASIKRLRNHSSYNVFMSKWSLPVYFQIRFQEIAGEFESSLYQPFLRSTDSVDFELHTTTVLWHSLHRCWHQDVMLQSLTHRFWKLTLQLMARYTSWLSEATQPPPILDPAPSLEADVTLETKPTQLPTPPVVSISQLVLVIADCRKLATKVPGYFKSQVQPNLLKVGVEDLAPFSANIDESLDLMLSELPALNTVIVKEIISKCVIHLKAVTDTPRLYRRTNRQVPFKASAYVEGMLAPIKDFIEEQKNIIGVETQHLWIVEIVKAITEQYMSTTAEVLNSVRKMEESLKRLKKARGSNTSSSAQGMSDDDKIRLQLYLDVKEYDEQTTKLEPSLAELEMLEELKKLVENEKNNSSV